MSLEGKVRKWDENNGKGIIEADDGNQYQVTRDGCNGGSLVVGLDVTFKKDKNHAVSVTGPGATTKGNAGAAKVAAREAARQQAETTNLEGVVVQWNELLGKGRIEYSKGVVSVMRSDIFKKGSLVVDDAVTFSLSGDGHGDLHAINVTGEAVVPAGTLEDDPSNLKGVKTGIVAQWSSVRKSGTITWKSKSVPVESSTFNLNVGAEISFEIRQTADGELSAINCSGVAVQPVVMTRKVSSNLLSMKFMKRKEEEKERLELQQRALKEREEVDATHQKMRASGMMNNNIRVIVSDDMPVDCHIQGKRRFGNMDAPRAKVDLNVPAPDPTAAKKKKSVRYTMGRDALSKKTDDKPFGTAKGTQPKQPKRKQSSKKMRKKRPKPAE